MKSPTRLFSINYKLSDHRTGVRWWKNDWTETNLRANTHSEESQKTGSQSLYSVYTNDTAATVAINRNQVQAKKTVIKCRLEQKWNEFIAWSMKHEKAQWMLNSEYGQRNWALLSLSHFQMHLTQRFCCFSHHFFRAKKTQFSYKRLEI